MVYHVVNMKRYFDTEMGPFYKVYTGEIVVWEGYPGRTFRELLKAVGVRFTHEEAWDRDEWDDYPNEYADQMLLESQ